MPPSNPKRRRFEAQFDGDEYEGKRYDLGDGVTGLDAPTAEFLLRNGRIAEIDEDTFRKLPGPHSGKKDAADEGEIDEGHEARVAAAKAALEAGSIPTDLLDPSKPETAPDRLISKKALLAIASSESVELGKKPNKFEIAVAIMAARAKAAEEAAE